MCICIHKNTASDKIILTNSQHWRLAIEIAAHFGYSYVIEPELYSRALKLIYNNYLLFKTEYREFYYKVYG